MKYLLTCIALLFTGTSTEAQPLRETQDFIYFAAQKLDSLLTVRPVLPNTDRDYPTYLLWSNVTYKLPDKFLNFKIVTDSAIRSLTKKENVVLYDLKPPEIHEDSIKVRAMIFNTTRTKRRVSYLIYGDIQFVFVYDCNSRQYFYKGMKETDGFSHVSK